MLIPLSLLAVEIGSLLITFVNSLDPDKGLNPNHLTLKVTPTDEIKAFHQEHEKNGTYFICHKFCVKPYIKHTCAAFHLDKIVGIWYNMYMCMQDRLC